MSDVKQVKVDNWGIYFLQRLKHFFNRTDYCDLTLQFQDNAQLKVHRLVLNACTEYFELLERTCEMYEDCLVMPEDLQADVVVPIVNFMYTGQLEFKMDLLEKLYQTSLIMNMPVLTKLLDSHRSVVPKATPTYSYSKRVTKTTDIPKSSKQSTPTASTSGKRSYSKAFEDKLIIYRDKNVYLPLKKTDSKKVNRAPSPLPFESQLYSKKVTLGDPRPTRYELPEELDTDNIFDSSFTNISYASSPLMIHPEVKQYSSKHSGLFAETLAGKKYGDTATVDIVQCKKKYSGSSNVDILECRKLSKSNNIFDDSIPENLNDETDLFPSNYLKNDAPKASSELFDQILESEGPNVTIESKDNKTATNLDHAKIISEVLKKYPHLVKSNKNIKLKILNTPSKAKKHTHVKEKLLKPKTEEVEADFTYETDVLDSKEAAKLIALGAENIRGPWICLICGTPGKALHFTSYFKFRRHLVDVHNEKPVMTICEYCGLKSLKRNCLLHHLYTKHGIEPPPTYHFPKCNQCDYIGLTEALLVKHKMSHSEARNFRCNVCDETFSSSQHILKHIQKTGHKYSAERKTNLQCVYCLKVFLRQTNLYAHLKTNHKSVARRDGIIEDSDEEKESPKPRVEVKYEIPVTFDNEYEEIDMQYQIQQKPDGNIHLVSRKQPESPSKQKILNADFSIQKPVQKKKVIQNMPNTHTEYLQNVGSTSPDINQHEEDIVMIDNNEYIVRDHQLIPKQETVQANEEYIISDVIEAGPEPISQTLTPATTIEYANIQTSIAEGNIQQPIMITKNSSNLNQPIQIVVSNEEEYKALMASNHPIIFDNGDANKTLTVLTAPHTASLDTRTIDLNNAQSNNMMIIQEDYPLNVTETVASDSSSIVVVYSHHVNQNKQYQLLTPQDIGTQFVQSSAIITQNYETVTTSTPVMSAHVLDTQEVWQNNVPELVENQHLQVASETQLHAVVEQDVPPIENDTSPELNELPQVQLIPVVQNSVPEQENMLESTLCRPIDMITEDAENPELQNNVAVQNTSSTPMDVNNPPSDVIIENEEEIESMNETKEPQEQSVIKSQEETVTENSDTNNSNEQVETESTTAQESDKIEENVDHTQETNVIAPIPVNIQYTTNIEVELCEVPENADIAESTSVHDIHKESLPKEAAEKIQSLTSEWSEDETESISQEHNTADIDSQDTENTQDKECATHDNILQGIQQNNSIVTDSQPEIEESIENIQQEVDKQMAEKIVHPVVDETINSQKNILPSTQDIEKDPGMIETNGNIDVLKPKISSILNDWDDNDSQEENSADSVNDDGTQQSSEDCKKVPEETGTVIISGNLEPIKNDKIKKLVSDWDDDEEESKDEN